VKTKQQVVKCYSFASKSPSVAKRKIQVNLVHESVYLGLNIVESFNISRCFGHAFFFLKLFYQLGDFGQPLLQVYLPVFQSAYFQVVFLLQTLLTEIIQFFCFVTTLVTILILLVTNACENITSNQSTKMNNQVGYNQPINRKDNLQRKFFV